MKHLSILSCIVLGSAALAGCGDLSRPDSADGGGDLPTTGIVIDTVSPAEGPISGGTTVTLIGTGFDGDGTTVLIDGLRSPDVEVVNGQTLFFRTPPHPETGKVGITVFNSNGLGSAGDAFSYLPNTTLSAISPTFGHARGGTTVTLTGTGFQEGAGSVSVLFEGVPIDFTVKNDTTIEVETPPGTEWTASDVAVRTRNGEATLPNAFTYMLPGLLMTDTDQGSLYHVDPATGVFETILANRTRGSGLAMTEDGVLFAYRSSQGGLPDRISRITIEDGAEDVVALTNARTGGLTQIADGSLLAVTRQQNVVFQIDPATGTVSTLLNLPSSCSGCAIASNGAGKIVFAPTGSNGELFSFEGGDFVSPLQLQSAVSGSIKAMTFLGNNKLLGIRKGDLTGPGVAPGGGGSGEVLVDINPSTGAVTDIAVMPIRADSLTVIPLPPDPAP